MGVVATYTREAAALAGVKAEEEKNYSTVKNQDCEQLLLDIKDIEIRISALPNQILLAGTSYTIKSGESTNLYSPDRNTVTYSLQMKLKAQQKVLAEILVQKKAQAKSQLCYEEAKSQETIKKTTVLNDLIVDSNVKAEEQIIPETEKKVNKTLLIGGGILLTSLLIIILATKSKN